MSDQPPPLPFESILTGLLSGKIDQGTLLRVPDLGSRAFWFGAALGAGAVLLLKSRAAAAPEATPAAPTADRQP